MFKRFMDNEQAKEFAEELSKSGIDCQIIDNSLSKEITFSTNSELMIRQSDFDKANKILDEKVDELLKDVSIEHYLNKFTNDELFDILAKPDEWHSLYYKLAQKILKDRGQNIDEDLVKSLKQARVNELSKSIDKKKTSIRRDIYSFLKIPDYNGFNDLSINEKIIILLKVLILAHIALFFVGIPVSLLEKLDVISKIQMKPDLELSAIQARNINYKPYFIFSILFFVPLLEEMSLRLFQTRFRINYFIISVSVTLGIIIENIVGKLLWVSKSFLLMSVSVPMYVLIISALIGCVLYLFRAKINRIEEFWNKNTGLIIYSVAALFAIAHMMNLKFEIRDLVFMPLILLPFFIGGLSLGYLRVRLGIIYSIALHFIFLALHFGVPELAILLKDYTHH